MTLVKDLVRPLVRPLVSDLVGGAAGFTPLFDELNVDLWLTPESGTPGLNAVTGNADFELTGTADGYDTGDGDQAVIQMSSSDRLDAASGFGDGTYLRELHNESQFWVLVYWDPQGDTGTWQVAFQTANGANAGYRMRMHGDGSGGQFYIHDGTTGFGFSQPYSTNMAEWAGNGGNVMLMQVNLVDDWIEAWVNGRTQRDANLHRRDISSLSFPASSSPLALTIPPRCDLNGDVMFASGSGILTDDQIARLLQYGRGVSWTDVQGETPNYQKTWRVIPGETTLQVVGCFSKDPNLRLYADSSRTTRGALAASSGSLSRDAQGWVDHTFTGLTADTTYQVFAEYASGAQDRRRIRAKTLPNTRDGLVIGLGGCIRFQPSLPISDSVALERNQSAQMQTLYNQNVDVFVFNGDDGYYDTEWTDLGNSGVPDTAAEFQQMHEYIFDRLHLDRFFGHTPFFHGGISDHDSYGNDLFGDEATNKVVARSHLEQRHGVTYPLAGSLYRSWQTPGLTWISLDSRTESDEGVQLTSTTQRAQMQTDLAAAVARGDFIIMFVELPWDDGESPSPAASWNNYTSERQDIFNRIVTAGAEDRIITVHGDHHAGGVDIAGAVQSGYDTGGTVAHPSILACRFNHGSAGGSGAGIADWPDYYDNGNAHWMKLELANNLTQLDITVTPYEQNTAKTPITRTIG